MAGTQLRVRKDINDLSHTELDTLITAFRGIQEKDPDDQSSFCHIAGLHGQPFRGAGYGNAAWWGGYCHHGNVLFPTWHRAYLFALEKALQSVEGCQDIFLPYWNQLKGTGLPDIFTRRKYTYTSGPGKGKAVDNPLYSYKLQKGFMDRLKRKIDGQDVDYQKPKGYETVRYPFSGLVGDSDKERTKEHNAFEASKGDEEVNK
jgi:tyrosinase